MTLTKQQKILAGILAIGLGALLLDRFVLSDGVTGPKPAAAHPPATATDPAAGPSVAAIVAEARTLAARVAGREREDGPAARLADYGREHDLNPTRARDGFKPSSVWVPPARADATAPTSTPPAGVVATAVEQFARTHVLMAVMGTGRGGTSGGEGVAIIDGQALRVGQTIDGFRLIEVRQRSVLLESTAGQVELRLAVGGGQ